MTDELTPGDWLLRMIDTMDLWQGRYTYCRAGSPISLKMERIKAEMRTLVKEIDLADAAARREGQRALQAAIDAAKADKGKE
jgi:hypothetical protein